MKIKHFFLTLFFAIIATAAPAQRITIDLPYFAGKSYEWIASEGEKIDTLAGGALDAAGKAVLTVPQEYEGRPVMSNFILTDGGGLDIILNGEGDFTAGSEAEHPDENDIYYAGSKENSFYLEYYQLQPVLLNKAGVMTAAANAYKPGEPLHQVFADEKTALENRFEDFQRQSAESPLYAGRIRQISDYINGIDSRIGLTPEESMAEQRRYVREVLDFSDLWNSGMWKTLLTRWMSVEAAQGDSALLADARTIFSRVKDGEIKAGLSKRFITLFHQYGKEALLMQLSGKEDFLSPGHEAPKLYLPDGTHIVPFNSLVIFFESGCNNCENELLRLRGNYSILQDKNIRVISVSADADEQVYKKTAAVFPWQLKLCDYKGFDGINFKNFAVYGTPTIYVIDGKGVITGRYAQLEEFLDNKYIN